MKKIRALIHAWLVLDFFEDARRTGGTGSSLTTTIFTQSFLALVFAALLYPETPPVPFAAANLCLSSLLVAIGTLGNQDQLHRRRAERNLLDPAPIGRATVVFARGGHAAFYVCLVTIGMALPPAVLLAYLPQHSWTSAVGYVVLACVCSGLATGALGVSMRILVRWLGHARAALLAASGKAVLLGGGFVLFALGMQRLQKDAASLPIGRLGAELLPPYHAARLLGTGGGEAWRILPLLGAGALLLLLSLLSLEVESPRRSRAGPPDPLRWLLRLLARRGPRLGIAEFVAVSMWRSAGFRSRVLPLLGLPAGMAFLSLQGEGQQNGDVLMCLLLQIPAIYLPFLIAFLPRADQTDTAWVFGLAPGLSRGLVQDATWRALVTHVLVPVHAIGLLLLWSFSSNRLDATAASLFALGIAVVAARAMVRSLDDIPFTQSREADAATDLGALFGAAVVLGGLGTVFGAVLPHALRWPIAGLVFGGAVWWLQRLGQPDEALDPASGVASAGSDGGTEAPERAEDPAARGRPPVGSLAGELRAIAALYGALCVLPVLIGTMFTG
ncbi:MAG TPA: hypothetical protein VFD82_13270 [Planctomycetota bacterium]|nr:hypothetical protein [Planctomycetota bacterium]